MKIVIPSTGKDIESPISPVFGRSPYFIVIEVKEGQIIGFKAIENPAIKAFRGAGIQAAQLVANEGVEVIITPNIGPNASNVLIQSGIKIVFGAPGVSVREAVEKFLSGEFKEIGGSSSLPPSQPGPGIRPGRGMGYGGPAECVCPVCGFRIPHQRGVPCSQHVCPRCGARMVRGQ